MNSERVEIDEARLKTPAQLAVRQLVSSLPEEAVSMTWRSELNEQLRLAARKRQVRRRFLWFASPIAGVSVAAAFIVLIFVRPGSGPSPAVPDRGIETAILSDHHASTLSNEISAAGLNLTEVTADANDTDTDYDSDGDDADSL